MGVSLDPQTLIKLPALNIGSKSEDRALLLVPTTTTGDKEAEMCLQTAALFNLHKICIRLAVKHSISGSTTHCWFSTR